VRIVIEMCDGEFPVGSVLSLFEIVRASHDGDAIQNPPGPSQLHESGLEYVSIF
jgi:hypothetical protein